jgi:hypothetical protein
MLFLLKEIKMASTHEKQEQLLVPDKIKVGYNKREETYTGHLAYVIYYDHAGVLKKEKSWEGWRNKDIQANDYANEPTEGFVLNRGVGGARYSYGWNARNEYVRVYDPRGFEIEITVANVLFILSQGACSPGKGLEGKFVYAWNKDRIVLLPVASQDYQNCKNYTKLQATTLTAKELVHGASYTTKKQIVITYVGYFNYYFIVDFSGNVPRKKADSKGFVKIHVFWDGEKFVYIKNVKEISIRNGDSIDPDYANLVDKYNKSPHGSKVVKFSLEDVPESIKNLNESSDDPCCVELKNGSFANFSPHYDYKWDQEKGHVKTGRKTNRAMGRYFFVKSTGLAAKDVAFYEVAGLPQSNARLFAHTENGSKIRVDEMVDRNYYGSKDVFEKEF